jgi:hypothetical protein
VLAGGLLRSAGSDRLIAAALAAVPSARPTVLGAPPVTGALLMALDRIGSTIDEAALAAAVAAAGLTGGTADAALEPGGGGGPPIARAASRHPSRSVRRRSTAPAAQPGGSDAPAVGRRGRQEDGAACGRLAPCRTS